MSVKTKRAAIFSGRPFWNPEVIPKRSGHRVRVMVDDAFAGSFHAATELDHYCHAESILNQFVPDCKGSF
jgi:hypothetical protein